MPMSEFHEMFLFEKMEPFGDRRADIHAATIAQLIANIHRGKDAQPFTLEDFMLPWDPRPEPVQTQEQMLGFMTILQAAQNANVEAQKKAQGENG